MAAPIACNRKYMNKKSQYPPMNEKSEVSNLNLYIYM